MLFPVLLDHVGSQSGFETIQAGFHLFLLLKEERPLGGTDGAVSRRMDLGGESFVFGAEPDDLGMLIELRLLLRRELGRCVGVGRQAGKPGHLLYGVVGGEPQIAGLGIKLDLFVQVPPNRAGLVVKDLISDRSGSFI